MKSLVKLLLLSLPLVACGGGSGQSSITEPVNTDYSTLVSAKIEPGPLRQASTSELAQLIKNGLRVSLRDNRNYSSMILESMALNASADNKSGGIFSGTNLQVDGVDEADSVKYDGKYIYLATPTQYVDDKPKTSLKIFATQPQAHSVTQISDTQLDTGHWGGVSEMYLVEANQTTQSIATIRRSWDFIALSDQLVRTTAVSSLLAEADILPYPVDNGIDITLYDVRSPTTPAKIWSLSMDGDLLGTRKIGNTLYVISSFLPGIQTLNFSAGTLEDKTKNEEIIAQTSIDKLLPEYSINAGASQPLITNGCMIPANTEKVDGSLSLINITAINLSTQQLVESVCVNGNVAGIYSSTNNLYLGSSDYSQWNSWKSYTVVHQFSLANGDINYSATGSVEGILGWNSPSFRMDEHEGYLRMVTSQHDENGEPEHQLHLLQKVSGRSELQIVAQLPNPLRPEPIGKPGEEIFAVRFNGDKAYIVTFERIDPLYVLDLSNTSDPKIAGQLEIPGFATYLHAVGEDYLFALGNETNQNGQATGVKVSLYDIRNPANPIETNKYVFGSALSWSSALYDHHALSFLKTNDDQLRIALPISVYEEITLSGFTSNRWLSEGLYQFEVNGLTNSNASLTHAGTIIGADSTTQNYPLWSGYERSFLHDDSVFYVHGDKVIGAAWSMVE
jgi:uncharacterized secreted protein with C-terminal beta-propeller domain